MKKRLIVLATQIEKLSWMHEWRDEYGKYGVQTEDAELAWDLMNTPLDSKECGEECVEL